MDVPLRIAAGISRQLLALRGTGRSLTVEVGDVFYQAASYDADQVLIEVPAAQFLPQDRPLPPDSETELVRLGFTQPTTSMPNWWIGIDEGYEGDLFTAAYAVTTALLRLYGVPPKALLEAVGH